MKISEAQNKAAGEFIDLLVAKLGSGRAVQSKTAVARTARLAGSLLFRSFNLNVSSAEPGTVVLSYEANEECPQRVTIMRAMLQHFGMTLNYEKLSAKQAFRKTFERSDVPALSVVESLALLQSGAMQVVQNNGLQLKETAQAAAMATAFLVKECARDLGPGVSCTIATYGFIEGCKTIPPAVTTEPPPPTNKNPWYKLR